MSDLIIRWWPKSGCTKSIASMDEDHAALAAEVAALRNALTDSALECVEAKDRLAEADRDAARYRWIHDNIDWIDGTGYVLNTLHPDADGCAMFQWGVDAAMVGSAASQPTARCRYCGVPDGDGHNVDCQHPSLASQPSPARCDHSGPDGYCPVCGPDGEPHPDAPPRQYWPDQSTAAAKVKP